MLDLQENSRELTFSFLLVEIFESAKSLRDFSSFPNLPHKYFQLKWHDAYGGHGEHFYDFNHGDSYKAEPVAYAPPKPSYSPSL